MKKIKEFIIREIAGETIMVPTGATSQEFNGIITLSATAKFIWEHIEEVESLEALVSMITEEYEIDRETATKDTIEYVQQLLANRMVALTREDQTW